MDRDTGFQINTKIRHPLPPPDPIKNALAVLALLKQECGSFKRWDRDQEG
jgi:hypothetical protein